MASTETETAVVPQQQQQAVKKQKKLKPARKQVAPGQVEKKEAPQTGKEYNIWYNKWAGGDREDSYSNKTKSQTRCHIKKDAGLTRADITGMKYYCLFFSRGCCPYGYECEYLHTLPTDATLLPDNSKDCFAREKFSDYRDDMGGVGTFTRQNRTLYVGRIKEVGTGEETEETVRRHFKEWGEVEKIRVLQYRSVAFVTYINEYNAQFAKEAMACQSLDNDEILNVRWATEDPNPTSKVAEKRRLEEMGREAIQARMDPKILQAERRLKALEDGLVLEDVDEDYDVRDADEVDAQDEEEDDGSPDAKRRRIEPPPQEPQPPAPMGLLSSDTLEGLKYFAEIRKRTGGPTVATAKPTTTPVGISLGDYGSDEDD
ncbi:hypothetical protein BJ322DRAFT_1055104 [Thelephora terrestris]|uniref:Pre-mRNA-splicing factor CWC2 n=1 Tax=Thelephora terrestris TaxID=56493 RepID=A0A9P6L8Q0_9AGAM|nr:hypothetical protein BJ322DRAFT_1055104 [Thelephora terrestris]